MGRRVEKRREGERQRIGEGEGESSEVVGVVVCELSQIMACSWWFQAVYRHLSQSSFKVKFISGRRRSRGCYRERS